MQASPYFAWRLVGDRGIRPWSTEDDDCLSFSTVSAQFFNLNLIEKGASLEYGDCHWLHFDPSEEFIADGATRISNVNAFRFSLNARRQGIIKIVLLNP